MTFLLVPHTVTATTATVWIGAIDEDVREKSVALEFGRDADSHIKDDSYVIELDASGWQRWKSYNPLDRLSYNPLERILPKSAPRVKRLHYQRVTLGLEKPLDARTSYYLKLHVDGHTPDLTKEHLSKEDYLQTGHVTTLPERLPKEEESVFTVLLGSCFYRPNDPHGMVGKTYTSIPEGRQPEIKILCGDQVYLDNPWRETTLKWYRAFIAPGLFRAELFRKYENNWTQVRDEDAGFRRLLRDGANYFISDDHEYWNGAPNFGVVAAIHTLRRSQRDWYFREAKTLFQAFQSTSSLTEFEIDPLSFCIADTRINRDVKSERFMDDDDLEAVKRWIKGLKGPGVLVIGQLVLAGENSIRTFRDKGLIGGTKAFFDRDLLDSIKSLPGDAESFLFDKDLPDYRPQYDKLIKYIKESPHSIVVLTGDVHFGRVAHGKLKPGSENKFVEVISSPMQVVSTPKWKWSRLGFRNKREFGTYTEAETEVFPELESHRVAYDEHKHEQKNHFVTIEFSLAEGTKVNMRVRSWPIMSPKDKHPNPKQVCHLTLP